MATNAESASARVTENLRKCLHLLQKAETDSEKLAALLLITKAVRAADCTAEDRKSILESIGFAFISRLLKTKDTPPGCPPCMFQSLALSILSSLCDSPQVASTPEMKNLIPLFIEVITAEPSDADDMEVFQQMRHDCYAVLTSMAATKPGCQALVDTGVVPRLVEIVCRARQDEKQAVNVLITMLQRMGPEVWDNSQTALNSLLAYFAKKISSSKDAEVFKMVDLMSFILSMSPRGRIHDMKQKWVKILVETITLMIKSKLGVAQRQSVLLLVSNLVGYLGVECLTPPVASEPKLLLLVTHLVAIEIRMATESASVQQLRREAGRLPAWYSLFEDIVKHMVNDEMMHMDPNVVALVHKALTGGMSAVIHLLRQVFEGKMDLKLRDPIVVSSLKILGAWMAEETEALNDQVIDLAPYLISIIKMEVGMLPMSDYVTLDAEEAFRKAAEQAAVGPPPSAASPSKGDTSSSDTSTDTVIEAGASGTDSDTSQAGSDGGEQNSANKMEACEDSGQQNSADKNSSCSSSSESGATDSQGQEKGTNSTANGESTSQASDSVQNGACRQEGSQQVPVADGSVSNDSSQKITSQQSDKSSPEQESNSPQANVSERAESVSGNGESNSAGWGGARPKVRFQTASREETSAQKENGDSDTDSVSFLAADFSNLLHVSEKTSKEFAEQLNDLDIVRYLLPGFIHLTSDDSVRHEMQQHGAHLAIATYFFHLHHCLVADPRNAQMQARMHTACQVLLNFSLLEWDSTGGDSLYQGLLQFIVNNLPSVVQYPSLTMYCSHLAAIGMAMIKVVAGSKRRRTVRGERQFFIACTAIFGRVLELIVSEEEFIDTALSDCFSELIEMWAIAIQDMTKLIHEQHGDAVDVLLETGFVALICRTMADRRKTNQMNYDMRAPLLSMIYKLTVVSPKARALIRQCDGLSIARTHELRDLEELLKENKKPR